MIKRILEFIRFLWRGGQKKKKVTTSWADLIAARESDTSDTSFLFPRKKGPQVVHQWQRKKCSTIEGIVRQNTKNPLQDELECDYALTLAHLYDTQDMSYERDWKKDDAESRRKGKL